VAVPINGKRWQVMRLSRNRNWGHPLLVAFLEELADKGPQVGWRGLLVGDLSQARGGPMLTGHASHQVGLDADIWLTPMPARELTRREREEMSATMVVAKAAPTLIPKSGRRATRLIIKQRRRAQGRNAFRQRCNQEGAVQVTDTDRGWLGKGARCGEHDYHFHIHGAARPAALTAGSGSGMPPGDGCGKELDRWFRDAIIKQPGAQTERPAAKPKPGADHDAELPAACRQVCSRRKRPPNCPRRIVAHGRRHHNRAATSIASAPAAPAYANSFRSRAHQHRQSVHIR
jgi:penicillin-insensitive murein endopeptidase